MARKNRTSVGPVDDDVAADGWADDWVEFGPMMLRRRFPAQAEVDSHGTKLLITYDIEVVDGRAKWLEVHIAPYRPVDTLDSLLTPPEPQSPEVLEPIKRLDHFMGEAILAELGRALELNEVDDMSVVERGVVDRLGRQASTLYSKTRRRSVLTTDFLSEVVAVHRRGGTKAVVDKYSVDPRTVTRWLARARQEGLR